MHAGSWLLKYAGTFLVDLPASFSRLARGPLAVWSVLAAFAVTTAPTRREVPAGACAAP